MKVFLSIVAVVLLVLVLAWFRIRQALERIDFDIDFDRVALRRINIAGIISGKQTIDLRFWITIWNKEKFSIPLSDVDLRIFYQNHEIGRNKELAKTKTIIRPNAKQKLQETLVLVLNQQTKNMLEQYLTRQNPELQWQISLRVFGMPFAKTGEFTLTE